VYRPFGGLPACGRFTSSVTTDSVNGERRSLVVDVPRRGATEIEVVLPMAAPYATVVVHALQLTEHAPFESWTPDPTPEDALAFRIVNPQRAPRDDAAIIRAHSAPDCRGY
jgi:hypothetical protein